MEQITLKVDGMKCGGCENAVRMLLLSHKGVLSAAPSFKDKQVVLEIDPDQISPEKICELLNAHAYSASI